MIGLGFYIFQFLPLVAIEAIVMWRMRWGSLGRSFFDATMMNFVSFMGLILGLSPYITGYGNWGITLFGTYSLMVEFTVLMLLEKHDARKVVLVALLANFAGCMFLESNVWLQQIKPVIGLTANETEQGNLSKKL